jgi:hypothetical protein
MSVQSDQAAADIDDAVATLKAAISAYTAAGGNGTTLAQWLISQLRLSDQKVALALQNNITRYIAEAPDRRSFASMG